MIPIIVWGAGGRMGKHTIQIIAESNDMAIDSAVELPNHPAIGQDIGLYHDIGALQTMTTTEPKTSKNRGVVLDFSLSGGPEQAAAWCADHKWNLVTGTTALSETDKKALQSASKKVAILTAPNFSLGIQLTLAFAAEASGLLPDDFEVTINETHHKRKKDRPSGTAKAIQETVKKYSNSNRQIDVSSLRIDDITGEHELRFVSAYEDITISHRALSRKLFATGAIKCVRWLANQPSGLYSMKDMLGLQ